MSLLEQGFFYTFAFSIIFWNIGLYLSRNLSFNLGLGRYCGFFPVLGSFLGAGLGFGFLSNPVYRPILLGVVFMGLLGFLRDYKRISYAVIVPYALLVGVLALSFIPNFPVNFIQLLGYILWLSLIVFCLKVASLVYEMPFILLCMTSLTILLYFFQVAPKESISYVLLLSILVPSFVLFFASNKEKKKGARRFILGSSGLFSLGFLLACLTIIENSGVLALFGLCIPSMVVGFPLFFISGMLGFSYFGNRLHLQNFDASARPFAWSLRREKAILFAGLVFLCINFGLLISFVKAPVIGLLFLLLLLSLAIAGFMNAFVTKKPAQDLLPKQVKVLDVEVDSCTQEEVLSRIDKWASESAFAHIITADSLALVRASEDKIFKGIMERAELVIPDGAGIVWASDFLGTPLKGRVPGVALVAEICKESVARDWGLYFLGGKPGIVEKAMEEMKKDFEIKISGTQHGYFAPNSSEEDEIIENICKSNANVVFVALGVPRQEHFIVKLRGRGVKAVAIGVGGSFDVISKELPRAPVLMQRFGIEWLFRLWLEPSRAFRMLKIPAFVLRVLRQKWSEN